MSGSFESVRWKACVYRLDLNLYPHPKEVFFGGGEGGRGGGMETEPTLTPKEKSPLPEKFSSEEDQTHNAASSRTASPTHYQLSYSSPPPSPPHPLPAPAQFYIDRVFVIVALIKKASVTVRINERTFVGVTLVTGVCTTLFKREVVRVTPVKKAVASVTLIKEDICYS